LAPNRFAMDIKPIFLMGSLDVKKTAFFFIGFFLMIVVKF
jgi:hypothetical protein